MAIWLLVFLFDDRVVPRSERRRTDGSGRFRKRTRNRSIDSSIDSAGRRVTYDTREGRPSPHSRLNPGLFFGAVVWLMQTLQLVFEMLCGFKDGWDLPPVGVGSETNCSGSLWRCLHTAQNLDHTPQGYDPYPPDPSSVTQERVTSHRRDQPTDPSDLSDLSDLAGRVARCRVEEFLLCSLSSWKSVWSEEATAGGGEGNGRSQAGPPGEWRGQGGGCPNGGLVS